MRIARLGGDDSDGDDVVLCCVADDDDDDTGDDDADGTAAQGNQYIKMYWNCRSS